MAGLLNVLLLNKLKVLDKVVYMRRPLLKVQHCTEAGVSNSSTVSIVEVFVSLALLFF